MARRESPPKPMTLQEYADEIGDFCFYPYADTRNAMAVNYCALELGNEAGEAMGVIKKAIRDDRFGYNGRALQADRREAAQDESGDTMFALFRFIYETGCDVEATAKANIAKLEARYCDPESPHYSAEITERRRARKVIRP